MGVTGFRAPFHALHRVRAINCGFRAPESRRCGGRKCHAGQHRQIDAGIALAVAIVFVLSGTGVAIAWAASEPTARRGTRTHSSAALSPSPPGKPEKAEDKGKGRELHSESVVKKADGSFEKRVTQIGTVESVSDISITVKSEDGFTPGVRHQRRDADRKVPKPAADGTAPKDSPLQRTTPASGLSRPRPPRRNSSRGTPCASGASGTAPWSRRR